MNNYDMTRMRLPWLSYSEQSAHVCTMYSEFNARSFISR